MVARMPAGERPTAGLTSYDRLFIGGQWVDAADGATFGGDAW